MAGSGRRWLSRRSLSLLLLYYGYNIIDDIEDGARPVTAYRAEWISACRRLYQIRFHIRRSMMEYTSAAEVSNGKCQTSPARDALYFIDDIAFVIFAIIISCLYFDDYFRRFYIACHRQKADEGLRYRATASASRADDYFAGSCHEDARLFRRISIHVETPEISGLDDYREKAARHLC